MVNVLTIHKRRKTTHEHFTRQQRETVARPKLLSHPLLGGLTLGRQLGDNGPHRSRRLNIGDDVAAYYSASLVLNPIYSATTPIPRFVVNEADSTVIFAQSNAGEGHDLLSSTQARGHGCYGDHRIFEAIPASLVDMSLSKQHQKLYYVSSGPKRSRYVLVDTSIIDPGSSAVNLVYEHDNDTPWQTAVSPSGQIFITASTSGIRLLMLKPGGIENSLWCDLSHQENSEFTAVAFGKDDRTIMAGKRSGITTFVDTRSGDSVRRLLLGDAVSAIRMIDEHRVVVRGLQKVRRHEFLMTLPLYSGDFQDRRLLGTVDPDKRPLASNLALKTRS
jgi:hypothetical protein